MEKKNTAYNYLPGKAETTGQATNIPQTELKQFKLSNYSGRDTPDSFNLLRCRDVNDQEIVQTRARPNTARRHWLSFLTVLIQAFNIELAKMNSAQH